MDRVAQQNAALVEEAAAAAESPEQQAASLAATLSVFRVADGGLLRPDVALHASPRPQAPLRQPACRTPAPNGQRRAPVPVARSRLAPVARKER